MGGTLVGSVQVLFCSRLRGRLEARVLSDFSGCVSLGRMVRERSNLDLWLAALLRIPQGFGRALSRGKVLGELARPRQACLVAFLARIVRDGGLRLRAPLAPLPAGSTILRIWNH